MKTLSLLLALCLPALAARADTFRIYVVNTKQSPELKTARPMELINATVQGKAVLQAYAEVIATPEKPGRFERVSDVSYVETWDTATKGVKTRATRSVGTVLDIAFVVGDEVRIVFKDTRLDHWAVRDIEAGALQPVFTNREIDLKSVLPVGTITRLGGNQKDEDNHVHYLVHRLPSATL